MSILIDLINLIHSICEELGMPILTKQEKEIESSNKEH